MGPACPHADDQRPQLQIVIVGFAEPSPSSQSLNLGSWGALNHRTQALSHFLEGVGPLQAQLDPEA